MIRYLRGTVRIRIRGAAPEDCMNRFARENLLFWEIKRQDGMETDCRVYADALPEAEKLAAKCLCVVEPMERDGLRSDYGGLRRRPVLVFGLLAAILLAFFLQNFVWFVQVEGLETLPEEALRRVLDEEGICFGRWSPGIETVREKNRLLERLSALRWAAVNADGCIARVLVSERETAEDPVDLGCVTNVVALRPGVLTRVNVLNGLAQVEVGDAVETGQLLISGLIECPTHLQATRAYGEIFASTLRQPEVRIPEEYGKKVYTGRQEICRTLIFQRNRINFSGNSSIFGTSCDRMIERRTLTLPGGYLLPLTLETVTLREYRLEPAALPQMAAQAILEHGARLHTQLEMTAGQLLSETYQIQKTSGGYRLTGNQSCEELISVTVPVDLTGKDEANGEDHQR